MFRCIFLSMFRKNYYLGCLFLIFAGPLLAEPLITDPLLANPLLPKNKVPNDILERVQQSVEMQPGDLLYVDFWASWCAPCRKSFPWMNSMHDKYQAQGLKIVAINVDSDAALAKTFLEKVPANFAIAYDPQGDLAEAFQLVGMPSSYLMNDQGVILSAHKGFFLKQTQAYEQEIQSFLGQSVSSQSVSSQSALNHQSLAAVSE